MDYLEPTLKTYKKLGKNYLATVGNIAPEIIQDFIALLPENSRILDVGCCGGRDSAIFAKKGFSVVGIDMVETFLEEARKLVPSGEFSNIDVRKMHFLDRSFDGIWASMILLHLKRDEIPNVLKSFWRILKPGGKIFIGVKKGEGEKTVTDKFTPGLERFFTYFTTAELTKLLSDTGFKPIIFREDEDNGGRGQIILRVIAEKVGE